MGVRVQADRCLLTPGPAPLALACHGHWRNVPAQQSPSVPSLPPSPSIKSARGEGSTWGKGWKCTNFGKEGTSKIFDLSWLLLAI